MKKSVFLCAICVFLIMHALPTLSSASSSITDISGHWAAKDILSAMNKGYVSGYPNGTFRPNGKITRAEAAGMLSRITKQEPSTVSNAFGDLDKHWSRDQVRKLVALGFIVPSDYPKGFEPDRAVTRYELMKWIATGLSVSDDSFRQALMDTKETLLPTPETYKGGIKPEQIPYIAVVKGTGIIEGFEDGSFRPSSNTTRAEVTATLLRYEKVEGTKADDYLALNELREVGRDGTNLTSLTPYVYGKNGEFKNIVDKPITLSNKVATLKVHRLIVVDKTGPNNFRGVYADMFTDGKEEWLDGNTYYLVFTEMTIKPLVDKLEPLALANGTVNGITNGRRIVEATAKNYSVPTLPAWNFSDHFKKGVSKRLWIASVIKKSIRLGDTHESSLIETDDGSLAFFTLLKENIGG